MKNKRKQLYREKRRKRFFCVWADSYACLINLTSRNPRTLGDKSWTTLSKIIFLCFRWIGLRMRKVPAMRRSFGGVGSVLQFITVVLFKWKPCFSEAACHVNQPFYNITLYQWTTSMTYFPSRVTQTFLFHNRNFYLRHVRLRICTVVTSLSSLVMVFGDSISTHWAIVLSHCDNKLGMHHVSA